jgi:hypothetical protein
MKDFLKTLPYKQALAVYLLLFLVLTIVGRCLGYDWYGFKFSIPIISITLIIDLLATYKIYKKWRKN